MKKLNPKNKNIEAFQYLFGRKHELITVNEPEIIFSLDGKMFYVTNCDARDWLTLEKIKGEDGEKYQAYSFSMWSVKSNPERVKASERNDLVELYCGLFKIEKPVEYAFVIGKDSQRQKIKNTDWLVFENGRNFVLTNDEVQNNYEIID